METGYKVTCLQPVRQNTFTHAPESHRLTSCFGRGYIIAYEKVCEQKLFGMKDE
ncbi:MAG: hypothetical protein M3430_19610 [Acidobacteriota bacterium]|nr:hypothetical protein [Acidobacteriota bacterium]